MGSSKQKTHTAVDMGPYGPTQAPLNAAVAPGGMLEQGAQSLAANPLIGQAQQYTSDVLAGKYLDPANNPGLMAYAQGLGQQARAGMSSMFGRAGRGNLTGGDVQQNMAQGITSAMAQPYFQLASAERGLQDQASLRAGAQASLSVLPSDWYLGQLKDIGRMGQKGTTDSTTTTTPSMGQTLGGIGLMALSAMGGGGPFGAMGAFGSGGAFGGMAAGQGLANAMGPWSFR